MITTMLTDDTSAKYTVKCDKCGEEIYLPHAATLRDVEAEMVRRGWSMSFKGRCFCRNCCFGKLRPSFRPPKDHEWVYTFDERESKPTIHKKETEPCKNRPRV